MDSKNFILTSSGLKNLILNDFEPENKFTFVFGKHEIKFHKIIAEFLSPFVSHLHNCDPTIDFISYNTQYNELKHFSYFTEDVISSKIVAQLQLLSKGSQIEITESESIGYRLISLILGNMEFYHKIKKLYPIETSPENIDKMIAELQIINLFTQNYNEFRYSDIIDYFSLNFSKIDKQKLIKLPTPALYSILYNDKLQVDNEDSFLDFISELISNLDSDQNDEIISLYEKVDFTKLSIQKFAEFVTNLRLSQMTETLWQKLCQYFISHHIQNKETKIQNAELNHEFKFDGNSNHRFDGIIQYINNENPID